MRRISLVLDGSVHDRAPTQAAIALALRLNAQIEGCFIRPSVSEIMTQFGGSVAGPISGDIIEQILKNADEFAAKAKSQLDSITRANSLAVFDKPSRLTAPGVSFAIVQGPPLEALTEATELSDLVVFGEPDRAGPASLAAQIELTMLTLRRPVLIARGDINERFGERVVVAFDGRHESCTALMRALPILTAAKSVEILHVHEGDDDKSGAADRALRYLGQNGVNATAVEAKLTGGEVGSQIASLAKTNDASLVIMGGYGRSRIRELILGGTTRYMMHSAAISVLFAH